MGNGVGEAEGVAVADGVGESLGIAWGGDVFTQPVSITAAKVAAIR